MAPVSDAGGVAGHARTRRSIYDPDGDDLGVHEPEDRCTFVRSRSRSTNIAGDKAFLSAGPAAAPVVTVGTAELSASSGDRQVDTAARPDACDRARELRSHDELDRSIEPEVPLHRGRAWRRDDVRSASAQLANMPVDVFPEFAPPKVEIQTVGPRAVGGRGRELVTVPLEQALNGVAGARRDPLEVGAAALVDRADLRAGHRPHAAPRQVVQERIATVTPTLPTWAAPPVMIQPLSRPAGS